MVVTLNIWVALFTCGLVIGIFMIILFVVFRKKYSFHVHNITIVLFILSFILFSEITEESDIVDRFPFLIGIATIADLLLWPFLLFYVQYIIGERSRYKWTSLLYFVPFIASFVWYLPFLLLPGETKLSYFSKGIPADVAWLVGFKMLSSSIFLWYIISLLSNRLKRFKNTFHRNKKVQFLSRTRQFFISITIIILIVYLTFFNQYFDLIPLGDSDRISSLIISGLFYFFGILIFRSPQLFQEQHYSKQVKGFFDGTELQFIEKILKLFDDKKIYLNEKLTVKDVAKETGLTNQQLSYLINQQLGINFLDFVNTYRVKEVQNNIQKGEHQLKTLLGLALESGFNSKSSFNRIFKNHTGFSPSDYVKKVEK